MGDGIEVSFVDPDGAARRLPLSRAAGLRFEQCQPIRVPGSYRRQGHWPGRYWCATTRTLILYESRLEQSWLLLCDFDPDVTGIAAQPFRLHFSDGAMPRTHVPDYFLLLSNGRERVIDVTLSRRLPDPAIQARVQVTREACALAGWDYRVVSEPDPVLLANVRWLAGFRRPVRDPADLAPLILEACRVPTAIGVCVDACAPRALVRPVLFHLMWKHRLIADLSQPLTNATLVSRPQEEGR